MKKTTSLLITGAAALLLTVGCAGTNNSDGSAKVGTHHFSIANALASEKGQEVLNPNISTSFAGGSGRVIAKGLVSNKKTNSFNKTSEEACQIAFLSAVKQFQIRAQELGGSKVVNLVSYYKKNTYTSKTEYECEVGNIMAGVALKGDIAR